MQYPELLFSIDGLTKKEGRSKVYQKFVKDFIRCGVAIDVNTGKLLKNQIVNLKDRTVECYLLKIYKLQ